MMTFMISVEIMTTLMVPKEIMITLIFDKAIKKMSIFCVKMSIFNLLRRRAPASREGERLQR